MFAASKFFETVWYFLIISILGVMILGGVLERPMLLSFATSESMEPTIGAGDLFLILPPFLSNIQVGDIIVFRSVESGYLVHRILADSEAGWRTGGDNSPFTDQQIGEPVVTPDRIAGRVVTVKGTPLVLRDGGIWIKAWSHFIQEHVLGVLVAVMGFGILTVVMEPRTKRRNRRGASSPLHLKNQHVLLFATGILMLDAVAFMLLGSHTLNMSYLVSERSDGKESFAPSTCIVREVEVTNDSLIPCLVILEVAGERAVLAQDHLWLKPRSEATVNLTIETAQRLGYYTLNVQLRRYLPLLPYEVISRLHALHPGLPILALTLALCLPFILLSFGERGPGRRISWLQRRRLARLHKEYYRRGP
jgi:signal peptidase